MINSPVSSISFVAGITGILFATSAQADVSIPEDIAQKETIPIKIIPGQTSAIHFKNEDRIHYLNLSDRSEIVYDLNDSPESGQAKSIFLKNIKPLDFPGEITSNKPNLRVIAIDREGIQKQYEFIVDNSNEHDSEIFITSQKQVVSQKPANTINTDLGTATPADISIGLKHKLKQGEISLEDPLVLYTSEAIALTLNSEQNLLDLARDLEIPVSVLSEFGRTGLAQKAKFRIQEANQRKANALKTARRSLIEKHSRFAIDTDLGQATLKDIEFGLLVMRQKETIGEKKVRRISKVIEQIKNDPRNVSLEDRNELQSIGRLGLAFSSRARIWGTIN